MCNIQPAKTLSSAFALLPENVKQQKANNNELAVIDVPNRIVSTKRVFPPDKYLVQLPSPIWSYRDGSHYVCY